MLVICFTAELAGENRRLRVITLAIIIWVNATKLITIVALQAFDSQIVRIRGSCGQHTIINYVFKNDATVTTRLRIHIVLTTPCFSCI